tara:strand:- start:282 stop:434 length:153 start_codon:yes stop_codon:yes gene_type:complete
MPHLSGKEQRFDFDMLGLSVDTRYNDKDLFGFKQGSYKKPTKKKPTKKKK